MCFSHDARPPIAPIGGAAVDHERLRLTAADGTQSMAFAAHPPAAAPGSPAIVVMPDVRGLYPFYEELALRFAERGTEAVAIDYFGRTTALGSSRGDDFEFMSQIAETSPATVAMDVRAAVEYLRDLGPANRPIFTVGFCFGGTHSWLPAASGHGLAGVVGFYGMPVSSPFPLGKDFVAPVTRVKEFACPVLALQGGSDPYIPAEHAAQFREALQGAGVQNDVIVYDEAPHSFFDREQATYQQESDDAWRRITEFIAAHS